ncbi:MAG: adenylate/guanylate cyclase domain-containing protein, partial [Chloroflexota bacterium]
MICSTCGESAPADARFCPHCGSSMAAACTNCGTPLVPGARFCATCGTPAPGTVVGPTPPTTPAVPRAPVTVSERRLVTIVFADLVGFTTLAESRDAEAVRDLLSRYFEQCQEVIGRYGGTVEKFIGDAVMAVWGAPIAHDDDAERAVRAALDLVDGVRALGPGIQARAGVLTGEAAVTVGATNQGLVAGDIVNTASRLQSVAAPGTVLVGDLTEQAANSAIAFEPAGEQVLKGKVAPVPAFRAIRIIAERGGRGRTDQIEAPFVGRDDEFRLLRDVVL